MIFINKSKDLKMKRLQYEKNPVFLGKIFLLVTFIISLVICMWGYSILPIDGLGSMWFTYGGQEVSTEDNLKILGVMFPILLTIHSGFITICINFLIIFLNKLVGGVLADETDLCVKELLNNMPIFKINTIDNFDMKISIQNCQMFRLLSFCSNQSLVDYGSKHSLEAVTIDLTNTIRTQHKIAINFILFTNNYYKYILNIEFNCESNKIQENSLKIEYLYVEEKELKRWCKVNGFKNPLPN